MSKVSGLSTARVRSLLNRMRSKNLVATEGKSSGRRGTFLTDNGKSIAQKIARKVGFTFIDVSEDLKNELGDYKFCVAHIYQRVERSTLEMRDTMVRYGAKGAIILQWNDNKGAFVFPEDSRILNLPPVLDGIKNQGTLIIGFGENEGEVNYATCALVVEILGTQIKI